MRKLLFTLILCVLLVVSVLFIMKGIQKGKIDIFGIQQIKEKNAEIDEKNAQLASLTNQGYPAALKTVEAASAQMKKKKEEYEEKAALLGNSKYYMQTEEYKLEFLWTKLGNYADDEHVDIKIDVTNGQISGRYNLNFTVTGAYTDVTEFIYDIENDSKLGFKIENFSMISGVTGTFSCKDIKIALKESNTETDKAGQEAGTQKSTNTSTNSTKTNSTNTNTTNTTKSTSTTNTTKATNTTTNSKKTVDNEAMVY